MWSLRSDIGDMVGFILVITVMLPKQHVMLPHLNSCNSNSYTPFIMLMQTFGPQCKLHTALLV